MSNTINIVLDLDDTLVYVDFSHPPDFLVYNSKLKVNVPYVLTHCALEFVQAVASIPGVRLSFFSNGERWRNDGLIPQLVLKAANAYSSPMLFHILKQLGLAQLALPKRLRYESLSKEQVSLNGKKDLRKIRLGIDLERTILVDDSVTSWQEQERNLLKLHSGLATFKKTLNSSHNTSVERIPYFDQCFRIKNSLISALGLIIQAIESTSEDKSSRSCKSFKSFTSARRAKTSLVAAGAPVAVALVDRLSELQKRFEKNCFNEMNREQVEEVYRVGLGKMREFNHSIDFQW
jgi:hypothetical protein